jgi:GTP-dependent phosphoenolpyruvate carboxykinase
VEAPNAIRPASRAVIRDVFNKRAMFVVPFCLPPSIRPHSKNRIGWFGHC